MKACLLSMGLENSMREPLGVRTRLRGQLARGQVDVGGLLEPLQYSVLIMAMKDWAWLDKRANFLFGRVAVEVGNHAWMSRRRTDPKCKDLEIRAQSSEVDVSAELYLPTKALSFTWSGLLDWRWTEVLELLLSDGGLDIGLGSIDGPCLGCGLCGPGLMSASQTKYVTDILRKVSKNFQTTQKHPCHLHLNSLLFWRYALSS